MRRLTTGIRSEKCVVRRFHRCAKVIECTYTNLDIIADYTPSLRGRTIKFANSPSCAFRGSTGQKP